MPLPPSPGITHTAETVRVLDGDTLELRVTSTMVVRLLDCWAPETHQTRDPLEKPRGLASKAHLESLCKPGTPVIVHVPFSPGSKFGDDTTMGRVLGHVWIVGQEQSLSEIQVAAGHATTNKVK